MVYSDRSLFCFLRSTFTQGLAISVASMANISAFTYEGKQMTYTHLPQGFLDSPAVFNRVLTQDLQNMHVASTVLQNADDIFICCSSKEQCERDSVTVLTQLAEGGQKVSKDKLQFCQTTDYLGRRLSGDKRLIALSQIEALPCWEWRDTAGHGFVIVHSNQHLCEPLLGLQGRLVMLLHCSGPKRRRELF